MQDSVNEQSLEIIRTMSLLNYRSPRLLDLDISLAKDFCPLRCASIVAYKESDPDQRSRLLNLTNQDEAGTRI